jgi:hypothetical protein
MLSDVEVDVVGIIGDLIIVHILHCGALGYGNIRIRLSCICTYLVYDSMETLNLHVRRPS